MTLLTISLAAVLVFVSAFILRDSSVIQVLAGANSSLERLLDTDPDDASAVSRLNALSIGWWAFMDRPLFGWGPENYYAAKLPQRSLQSAHKRW